MAETVNFIKDRAVQTRIATKSLADSRGWTKKIAAQLLADIGITIGNTGVGMAIIGQVPVTSEAKKPCVAAAGLSEARLSESPQRL